MKAKYLLLMAALALLVMIWCSRRTEQGTVEFTFTGDRIQFAATAESLTVDWDDGSIAEYHNLDSTAVVHRYASNAERTVRIRKAKKLSAFNCSGDEYRGGSITALDVSDCPTLTALNCCWNELSALDVSNHTALTSLECGYNQLSVLDVSKNTALTALSCSHNRLSALDVSKNTVLTALSCYDNELSALDVSKHTALTSLSCRSNRLSALDVSNNTALTTLYCSYNQLSALDVSRNTAL
ncbi:MAG: hypothetical protein LBH72_01590, partial [Proteiniphilum sp.]|nr:hypothetical protein [Proteiniphilum sp.]